MRHLCLPNVSLRGDTEKEDVRNKTVVKQVTFIKAFCPKYHDFFKWHLSSNVGPISDFLITHHVGVPHPSHPLATDYVLWRLLRA